MWLLNFSGVYSLLKGTSKSGNSHCKKEQKAVHDMTFQKHKSSEKFNTQMQKQEGQKIHFQGALTVFGGLPQVILSALPVFV